MLWFSVGDKVRVTGTCRCTAYPPANGLAYHDIRDCFQRLGTVGMVFGDGKSVWVQNRYGFARRLCNEVLAFVGGGHK